MFTHGDICNYTHIYTYIKKKLYMPISRVFKWTFTSLTSPWHFINIFINIECFSFTQSLCKFTINIETPLLSIRTMLQLDNYISCNFQSTLSPAYGTGVIQWFLFQHILSKAWNDPWISSDKKSSKYLNKHCYLQKQDIKHKNVFI